MKLMNKLVLLRHGQSQWNLENKFTGWRDVPLTEKGHCVQLFLSFSPLQAHMVAALST